MEHLKPGIDADAVLRAVIAVIVTTGVLSLAIALVTWTVEAMRR